MIRAWNWFLLGSACLALAGCVAEACPEGEVERDGACVAEDGFRGVPDAGTSDAAVTDDLDASIDVDVTGRLDSGHEPPMKQPPDSGMDGTSGPSSDGGSHTRTPVESCETATCHENATCHDSGEQPECECAQGFEGDGLECTRNECLATDSEPVLCDPNAACTDPSGALGDVACECNEGYEGDGFECTRNECIPIGDDAAPCGAHASCVDPSPSVGTELECACEPSFASCDGSADLAPGCETNLRTSASHCGQCGYACAGDLGCSDSECEQAADELVLGPGVSCALVGPADSNGGRTLQCWGSNESYQLRDSDIPTGNASGNFRASVKDVPGLGRVRDVAFGIYHACALSADSDDLSCWGADDGTLRGTSNSASITELVTWEYRGAVELAAAQGHSCVLHVDGNVGCWGNDLGNGALGQGTYVSYSADVLDVVDISNAVQIDASGYMTCARLGSGRVSCWGGPYGMRPMQIEHEFDGALTGATHIDLGGENSQAHGCAVRESGQLACWGGNRRGQLGRGTTSSSPSTEHVHVNGISGVVDVATGAAHTCALDTEGQVFCWGLNEDNVLGLDPGAGVQQDGEQIVARPRLLPGLNDVIDIEADGYHTCARKGSGQVICWGRNDSGQLGDHDGNDPHDDIVDVVGLP